jgi:hypothetical protein
MDFIALDRARSQLSWARRELERFEQTADEADPHTPRIRRRLQEHVEKAERDLRHAQGRYEGVFPQVLRSQRPQIGERGSDAEARPDRMQPSPSFNHCS